MARKRGTRAEVAATWRERLARWDRLQCSISEFCRREGISQPSFYQWRKRLGQEGSPLRRDRMPRGAAFIPVEVVPDEVRYPPAVRHDASSHQQLAWFELSLGRLVCRVPAHADEAALRRLVRVLCEEAARC